MTAAIPEPPSLPDDGGALDISPLQQQLVRDPYPLYALLREGGRAHWCEWPMGWLIPGHADVVAVLRDPRLGVDRRVRPAGERPWKTLPLLEGQRAKTLFFMDPPDHTRLRDRVRHAFTPRKAARLRGRIEAIANELLDAKLSPGQPAGAPLAGARMELIADFAFPLPVRVIAELLGVPVRDLSLLRRWSDDLAVLLVEPFRDEGANDRCARSIAEMREYFDEVFAERRAAPEDDLISEILAGDGGDERGALSDEELHGLVGLILAAGHETTANLIGNSVLALLGNPDARRTLERDPARIPAAVEELLRYESPVQVSQRIALEDCEVAGQRVRRGDRLYALLGSANRDPEAFAEPDRLDLDRGEVRHVAFGQGRHFCLGASLARLEGAVALEVLLRRAPGLALAEPEEEPAWRRTRVVLRGLEHLHLRL